MRKLRCLELTVVLALAFAEMAFAQGVSTNKPVPVTAAFAAKDNGGIIVIPHAVTLTNRDLIVALAARLHMASIR